MISRRSPPPTPVITPTNTARKTFACAATINALAAPETVKIPSPIESASSIKNELFSRKFLIRGIKTIKQVTIAVIAYIGSWNIAGGKLPRIDRKSVV